MKKKVLLVGLTGGVGGVETFITNIIKYIDYNKFEVECLVHQDVDKKYKNDLKDTKVNKIIGLKENPFKFIKDIIKFYKNNKYDVIHLNECTSLFFIYVFPILFDKKVKLIVHSHNGNGKYKMLHKLISVIQNKRANLKLACSDVAGKWMFAADDYELINNGIDLNKYKFNSEIKNRLSKELNIENKVIIGSVARFDKQKNHLKIINIFKEYYKKNQDSFLILVGDGEEKNNIIELINRYKLNNSTMLLGIRDDVNDLLKLFDILLMPSLYEGLPFIMIEAQAASLPILASENISRQIEITDLIYREKLDASDKQWAKNISNILEESTINKLEKDYNNILKEKGFDFVDIVNKIMDYYIS